MEKGPSSISNPIPSSTVILIRDVGKGPEILLVLSHKKVSFGANYGFPGGTLEPIDELTLNNDAVKSEKMNNILGLSSGGPAYYSAAIRELFEEVGVLLVYKADNSGIDNRALESYRDKVNKGCVSWIDFLHHNHLLLDYNSLHYFSFWIAICFTLQIFFSHIIIYSLTKNINFSLVSSSSSLSITSPAK